MPSPPAPSPPHRRIGILVRDGVSLSSLHIFRDMMKLGDRAMEGVRADREGKPHLPSDRLAGTLSIILLSADGQPVRSAYGDMVQVDAALSDAAPLGLLYIPSHPPSMEELDHEQPGEGDMARAIAEFWQSGTIIGAAGSGVVTVARSGILNGRVATLHWLLHDTFRRHFPRVKLDPRRQITEDSNILCTASLGSEIALACQLMSRLNTNWVGERIARLALPDFYEPETSGVAASVDPASVVDSVVSRALLWLTRNYAQPLNIAELAETLSISERTLLRRFQNSMKITPHAYVRKLRLASAARTLQLSNLPIAIVASRVGYTDVDFFRRIFRDRFGVSPTEYRRTAREMIPGRAAF